MRLYKFFLGFTEYIIRIYNTISFRKILFQTKYSKYRSLKYRFFLVFHTRQSGGLFPLFCAHGLFIYSTLIKLPFGRPRQTKSSTRFIDGRKRSSVSRGLLIEHRFTFGRYFINPKRLVARKNFALLVTRKPCRAFNNVLFLTTSRATKSELLSEPRCYCRSRTHFLRYNFPIFSRFNTPVDCHQRNIYKIKFKSFLIFF